jgi:hypothetical protein
VWELYGRRQSKPIVGDKSPGYVKFLPVIQRVLPGIRVIHIIRDGRDCFASQMHSRFSLFSKAIRSPGMQASEWCGAVEAGRHFGPLLDAYLEVRYEQLVLDPHRVLQEICSFIGVPYEAGMVSYHTRAEARLRELGDRLVEGGRRQTGKARREAFALTRLAPDETRIGRWRETLFPEAVHEYEKIAGGLLTALGYESSAQMLSNHDELSSQITSERVAAALSRYEPAEARRLAVLAWRASPNSQSLTAKLLTLAEWTQDLAVHWRMEVVSNQGEIKRFGSALPAWNGESLGDARRLLIWKYYRQRSRILVPWQSTALSKWIPVSCRCSSGAFQRWTSYRAINSYQGKTCRVPQPSMRRGNASHTFCFHLLQPCRMNLGYEPM